MEIGFNFSNVIETFLMMYACLFGLLVVMYMHGD